MPKSVVRIAPTRNKKYRVQYYGANGEMLASSEVLNTIANVRKNVKAMKKLMEKVP